MRWNTEWKRDARRSDRPRLCTAPALDTYASKKYGDYWEIWPDSERLAEEFDEWLERKEREEYGCHRHRRPAGRGITVFINAVGALSAFGGIADIVI
jgi:hypothetical protein